MCLYTVSVGRTAGEIDLKARGLLTAASGRIPKGAEPLAYFQRSSRVPMGWPRGSSDSGRRTVQTSCLRSRPQPPGAVDLVNLALFGISRVPVR